LEIDANNKTECDINGKKINIAENKKISGSDPTGLVKTYNNYWFEITNLNRNYTISCEKDFITTLLYQKPGSSVIHVSSQVHSTPAGDSVTESVNSFCFATSSSCDYEGSLWATIALVKDGEDVSSYLPYLSAMSEEALNKKYIPQAFLYMLTNEDDYYSELVKQQVQGKEGKYWDSSNRRLFDTSLAVLAIQNSNSQELDDAKAYFLSVQEKSGDKVGCWNDNTAFILYSAWPRDATKSTSANTESTNCESFNHYCVPSLQCSSANVLVNFNCPGLNGDVCCKTQAPLEETCSQKNGIVCNQNEKCSGSEVPAQDTNFCCTNGACESVEQTNSCEDSNYNCRTSCLSTEVEKTELSKACGFDKCCAAKPASQTNWLLIILLVILIILVILAIVFRNQLRIWMFKTKSGFGYGKPSAPGTRPLPPPGFRPIFPSRPAPAHLYQTQQRRAPGRPEKDKDFEDTMRKLRDMSK
jgi:hypothetical protein